MELASALIRVQYHKSRPHFFSSINCAFCPITRCAAAANFASSHGNATSSHRASWTRCLPRFTLRQCTLCSASPSILPPFSRLPSPSTSIPSAPSTACRRSRSARNSLARTGCDIIAPGAARLDGSLPVRHLTVLLVLAATVALGGAALARDLLFPRPAPMSSRAPATKPAANSRRMPAAMAAAPTAKAAPAPIASSTAWPARNVPPR